MTRHNDTGTCPGNQQAYMRGFEEIRWAIPGAGRGATAASEASEVQPPSEALPVNLGASQEFHLKRMVRTIARSKAMPHDWLEEQYRNGCAVTGLPFVFDASRHVMSPELDRIVPGTKGGKYNVYNCQVICRGINAMKSDRSQEEVEDFILKAAAAITYRRSPEASEKD